MAAKTTAKTPVRKPKKAISAPKPRAGVKKAAADDGLKKAMIELARSQTETRAELARSQAETRAELARSQTETRAELARSQAETHAELTRIQAKTHAEVEKLARVHQEAERANKEVIAAMKQTMRELSESLDKTTQEMRQTTHELSESLDKTTQEMRQTTQELSETIHRLDDNVGGINRSLGRVVELVVLPGLMEKMNTQFGYRFDNVSPNKKFTDMGKEYAEIDLFLENGESVMAVEAKTRVRERDMNRFLERLDALRQHEIRAGVVGKTIYAAVAGISFDDNARKIAEAKGMYFVDINQNNDKIDITPPANHVGTW
jgi:cell division septum initiation protein DivIVA